jgi:hypothetical protein
MKLKDSELKAILAEAQKELTDLLKSEQGALKKAAEESPGEPEGSAAAGGPPEASGAEAGSPPPPATEGAPEASATDPSASPAPEGSPEMSASPEASAAPAEESGPMDPEALKAEFAQMDPETLKVYYMAVKQALFEKMGAGQGGPEASAPPMAPPAGPEAGAPPGPEASASAMPPPAMKGEMEPVPASGNALKDQKPAVPDDVKKSEATFKAQIEDQAKQIELLTRAVEIQLGTPIRKAVTGVEPVAKSEDTRRGPPTAAEIKVRISKTMKSNKLNKSQKDQLFSYTLGNTEFKDIEGLLEK